MRHRLKSTRSASYLPPCGRSCVNSRNKDFQIWKEPRGHQMLSGATYESVGRARHQAFQSLSLSPPVTMVSLILTHLDKAAFPESNERNLSSWLFREQQVPPYRELTARTCRFESKKRMQRVDSVRTPWFLYSCGLLVFLVVCLLCQREFVPCAREQGKCMLDRIPSPLPFAAR